MANRHPLERVLLQLHEQLLGRGSNTSFRIIHSRMGNQHQPGGGHSELCGAGAGSFCKFVAVARFVFDERN